ncbi:MAG: hypothetical protein JXD22_12885 [Sedimentisphaerales bacterium]|nr:hypothetical protein [Sedimentisphaerales bacterium]
MTNYRRATFCGGYGIGQPQGYLEVPPDRIAGEDEKLYAGWKAAVRGRKKF